MAFYNLLDPVLGWILLLQPWLGLLILSLLISLIIVIVYKLTTDQDLMKRLKTEIKEFQKEMKELKGHPEKAMEVNKKAMQTNMNYMKHSMKPTLFTFIPIILIFSWMNANIAYEPLLPGQQFSVTAEMDKIYVGNVTLNAPEGLEIVGKAEQEIVGGTAKWTLKGEEGDYFIELIADSGSPAQKSVKIASTRTYAQVEERYDGNVKRVKLGNAPVKPLGTISLFGWKPGWLGTYIILSIIFSMALRKIFKVY